MFTDPFQNIGRQAVTAPISPTARKTGVKKAVEKVAGKVTSKKKTLGGRPARVIKENGQDVVDLTED